MKVAVAGAGWAGLAAAATLSRKAISINLFESSKQLGGRARSVTDGEWFIDNGQHIMLGSYHHTLNLLSSFGVHERKVVRRKLLQLEMHANNSNTVTLKVPNVAAPMHLLWGLMRAKGLDLHERGTALRLGARLIRNKFNISEDLPLEKWLLQNGQTRRLIQFLWQPLCLAILNTPIKEASTRVFLHILKKNFGREREDSDMLFFLPALTDCMPTHAKQFIEQHHGKIHLSQRVTGLAIEQNTLTGIYLEDELQPCEQLILATPPWVTKKLLAQHEATRSLSHDLEQFHHHPICTVYIQYPDTARLGTELIGLVDSIGHWVFDRGINGQPGLMAVVICGPGKHMTMDNETLAQTVMHELSDFYPNWPAANCWRVMREKRATFGCETAIQSRRPGPKTPVKGLWLAGDYLNTGYPSTLEGAVKSGIMSAKGLMAEYGLNSPARATP